MSVAAHYNAVERTIESRNQSPILQMRNLNNWIKSVLLNLYIKRGHRVFDLCCGKGGDLQKFTRMGVSLVFGADIADGSIQEARSRYEGAFKRNNPSQRTMEGIFVVADCCSVDLAKEGQFPPGVLFDIVSCQFAFHYCFESEAKARMMLHNASARLQRDGYFIGTLPNSSRLVKRLRESDGLSFGNSIYKVTFEEKPETPPVFGFKYLFHLEDAIYDLHEYVTHIPDLQRLAKEYNLELELCQPFHEFFTEHRHRFEDLFNKIHVFNSEGKISADEWEAAGLYVVFAFRKT